MGGSVDPRTSPDVVQTTRNAVARIARRIFGKILPVAAMPTQMESSMICENGIETRTHTNGNIRKSLKSPSSSAAPSGAVANTRCTATRPRTALRWVPVMLRYSPLETHNSKLTAPPVIRSQASMYLARVPATTSSGSGGGGLFLSQPLVESQSRTNCLSNDGWPWPGSY